MSMTLSRDFLIWLENEITEASYMLCYINGKAAGDGGINVKNTNVSTQIHELGQSVVHRSS